MTSWHEQTFGACPHGGIKPYCARCVGDDLQAKAAERQQKRAESDRIRELSSRNDELKETVANQSAALDSAYAHVRALERRLRAR